MNPSQNEEMFTREGLNNELLEPGEQDRIILPNSERPVYGLSTGTALDQTAEILARASTERAPQTFQQMYSERSELEEESDSDEEVKVPIEQNAEEQLMRRPIGIREPEPESESVFEMVRADQERGRAENARQYTSSNQYRSIEELDSITEELPTSVNARIESLVESISSSKKSAVKLEAGFIEIARLTRALLQNARLSRDEVSTYETDIQNISEEMANMISRSERRAVNVDREAIDDLIEAIQLEYITQATRDVITQTPSRSTTTQVPLTNRNIPRLIIRALGFGTTAGAIVEYLRQNPDAAITIYETLTELLWRESGIQETPEEQEEEPNEEDESNTDQPLERRRRTQSPRKPDGKIPKRELPRREPDEPTQKRIIRYNLPAGHLDKGAVVIPRHCRRVLYEDSRGVMHSFVECDFGHSKYQYREE